MHICAKQGGLCVYIRSDREKEMPNFPGQKQVSKFSKLECSSKRVAWKLKLGYLSGEI